jgi:ABC-type multidrug transport system ATPase subunit
MSDAVLSIEGLTAGYDGAPVIRDVDLRVGAGEVVALLGPNGAGKTTTLRMLLGLVRPTDGTATVFDLPAGRPEVTARVGALVEGPGFYPYLSGRDNLLVMARYRGLPASVVDDALEQVDLADRADDRFKSYSLGMKQRLGVASALMGDPDLIVLDEPTNGLDPAGMAEMRALIVALARRGATVLLSSHLLTEVQEICDRVGVISDGRLVRESTVADLRGRASLRLRAHPIDLALAVAEGVAGVDAVRTVEDRLVLDLPASAAPGLVRRLVAAEVDVLEIASVERTLEEVFFEMTTPHPSGHGDRNDDIEEAVR